MKRIFHKAALQLERILSAFKPEQSKARVIEPYAGYATPERLIIRGRVLTAIRRQSPQEDASRFANFREMLSLFLTDEVADVRLTAQGIETRSDDEGYFSIALPRPEKAGWHEIPVQIESAEDRALCPALVPKSGAKFVVISDIDDTVLETGAYSLARNLWTSMTGNILNRKVFPDAVSLLDELSDDGLNPIFFVSSSPWNLYAFLVKIFERNALPRAPMFLRDLGLSEDKFITGGHGNHKGSSIDTLIEANPDLPVILLGDTGQKDSEIYAGIVSRHPGRVAAVILRETADGSDQRDLDPIQSMETAGVTVFHGPVFPEAKPVLSSLI